MVDTDQSFEHSRIIAISLKDDFMASSVEAESKSYVYPNPVLDNLFVDYKSGINIKTIKLFDLTGKKLFDGKYDNRGGLDFSKYSPGHFILTIETEDGSKSQHKVIKE
jgi:hypothetical protein